MSTAAPLGQLAQAIDATRQVINAIAPGQWQDPSPCSEWTVAQVAGHLVEGNFRFAILADGHPRPPLAELIATDDELPAAYGDSGVALLEAFGQPGALDRIVTVPLGQLPGIAALRMRVVEILVHGWDLAVATGQRPEFPADLAEAGLAFTLAKLSDIPAGQQPFAPAHQVAADAPAIDRLAACLGRDVGASSGR